MIEIKRATTKRDFKKFLRFPDKLYRGNEFYVPPIEFDELNMTNPKKNACYEECEVSYFLAYKDGKLVGRISGIISHPYNNKNNSKYARFSRFECINDQEVANKLFEAAESWAKEQGMEKIHGPLGFNDLEREGLQVEGFDVMGTFQEAYNYPYYKDLVENAGYVPDAKWVEWRIPVPENVNERTAKLAKYVGEHYLLSYYTEDTKKDEDTEDDRSSSSVLAIFFYVLSSLLLVAAMIVAMVAIFIKKHPIKKAVVGENKAEITQYKDGKPVSKRKVKNDSDKGGFV
mgnify:CR=1 FL=1